MQPLRSAFPRTTRVLAAAGLGRHGGTILALVMLFGGWVVWLLVGRVPIYVVSQQARLETTLLPMSIDVPTAGVVVECPLKLANLVNRGDLLFKLDTRTFELQRDELAAQLQADQSALDSLDGQLDAETRARDAVTDVARKTARAGAARVAASKTSSGYKKKEADIIVRLQETQLASGLDKLRAQAEAQNQQAQVGVTSAEAALTSVTSEADVRDRDTRVAALRKSLADTHSLMDVHRAHLKTAEYEIELRTVRASVGGRLADVAACTSGKAVAQGDRLATLVPESEVHVVSYFHPEDCVGRVQPGKKATLRIDNFPWTQFGTVGAVVDRVGSEPRENLIRVEMVIDQPNAAIPITDGLTALAEVEVERISPMQLLLRSAGQYVAVPAAPQPAVQPPSDPPRAAR